MTEIEKALIEDNIQEINYYLTRIRRINRFKIGKRLVRLAINKKWGIL